MRSTSSSGGSKSKRGMTRTIALLLSLSGSSALRVSVPRTVTRRSALESAATALGAASALAAALPAAAFDTPSLEAYDDPKAKAAFATLKNPPLDKQASASFYAITTGDLPGLKKMVEAGWELGKATDTAGKTPLHRAAQVGNTGAVTLLLDAGCDPSVINKFEETPLHMATRNGKLPAVKALIAAGANPKAKTFGGDTALVLSKKYKMAAVQEYLESL